MPNEKVLVFGDCFHAADKKLVGCIAIAVIKFTVQK
jgi:hypothetical protein